MLFKTLWKMILGRTKLALVRAGAPPRCHWQHGGEGTRGAAGQGPDQPGRGTASQRPSPISSKPFPLQPPQCKPGAGWGLALPLLVTPLAAAPWGWCPQWVQLRSQRLPHHQLRAGLPDPSFSVPLLDMEGFHDAKLNQEKPVRGLKLVPGEAFPHGV